MAQDEERQVVSVRTPTAYNFITLISRELARRKRADIDILVTLPTLLNRSEQIVNETEPLYYEEVVQEEED